MKRTRHITNTVEVTQDELVDALRKGGLIGEAAVVDDAALLSLQVNEDEEEEDLPTKKRWTDPYEGEYETKLDVRLNLEECDRTGILDFAEDCMVDVPSDIIKKKNKDLAKWVADAYWNLRTASTTTPKKKEEDKTMYTLKWITIETEGQ